ncbi:hypothetical protein Q8A67_016983 [Cirrhinus molitorella]|uniref:Uncharacterized protein n=2 Tax=Cirrhinus molitorella TaxID=172907 RepID=A0AA88PDX3_9TELE|nr:hypothetical protein Q8A67_016983 [Cirrhinus molitorella]
MFNNVERACPPPTSITGIGSNDASLKTVAVVAGGLTHIGAFLSGAFGDVSDLPASRSPERVQVCVTDINMLKGSR